MAIGISAPTTLVAARLFRLMNLRLSDVAHRRSVIWNTYGARLAIARNMGAMMAAFDGLRIPYDRTAAGEDPEPGPAHYPGDYGSENSNTPYLYPWGRKERNPFFVGPYPAVDELRS